MGALSDCLIENNKIIFLVELNKLNCDLLIN